MGKLTDQQWNVIYPDSAKQRYTQRMSTLDNYKRREGCNDCGTHDDEKQNPGDRSKFEFHHVSADDYSFHIGDHISRPWPQIWAEIQKCVVLCRPCHAKRHVELRKTEGPGSRYRK